MKLTIESTEKIVTLVIGQNRDEAPARIWEGRTEDGTPCLVYVTRVAVDEGLPPAVCENFERQLKEQKKPSAEVQAIPLRFIL